MDQPRFLEAYLADLLKAILNFLTPMIACAAVAAGAHAALWLVPEAPAWLGPVAVAAAVLWLGAGMVWGWRRCPVRDGLRSLVHALGEATGIKPPSRMVIGSLAVVLLIGLALPVWMALVVWNVVLLTVVGYRSRGVWLFHVLGALLVVGGLLIIAAAIFVGDGTVWIGPTFAGLLIMQFLVAAVAPVILSRRSGKVWLRLLLLVPFAIPFGLPLLSDGVQQGALVVIGLVIVPAMLLGYCEMAYNLALGQARQILAEHEAKEVIGRRPRQIEDELRESDGYCQLHYPEFRHWNPEFAGEAGYLAWFKPPQECVAFRATSLFSNPCLEEVDGIGQVLAQLTRDLLPDLGLTRIEHLNRAFHSGWNVNRLDTREIPLAKMPWDHPFLLTVPVQWMGTFVYPPGSGIHDRDEFPCVVKKASVRIRLRDSVLAAASHCGQAESEELSDQDRELCRTLLWNAWRLLPGAYEALLTTLVEQFRAYSIALFMEHDEATFGDQVERELPTESKSEFVARLNQAWNAALPAPLGELIEVSVLDIFVDTYLGGDVRKQIFQLRILEANRPLTLQRRIRDICDQIGDLFKRGDQIGLQMIDDLQQAKGKILHQAGKSRDSVFTKLGAMQEGAPRDAFPDAQRHVTDGHDQFVREVDRQFRVITERLKEVVRIYSERTW